MCVCCDNLTICIPLPSPANSFVIFDGAGSDIVSPLQTKESLLLKYARAFEGTDGARMYNKK